LAEAMPRLGPAERRKVQATVGHRDASDEAVRTVAMIFERSGARLAVERRLHDLVGQSSAALDEAGLSRWGSACLTGAARALTARRR
jgi:hypothetical protein